MNPQMQKGYAETSSRKRPVEPEIVVVGETEIASVRYIGTQFHDDCVWNIWKVPNKSRYYFQVRLGE